MPSVDELLEEVYGIRVIRDHPYMPGYILLLNVRALEPRPEPDLVAFKVGFGYGDGPSLLPLPRLDISLTP